MTTELQPKFWSEEPIREAATLLRRIGFFLLFGAAPAFSPYSKRSLLVSSSIGAALIAIAAIIEGDLFSTRALHFTLPLTILLIAGFTYLLWSGMSLAWTPFPGESGGRYATFVAIALSGAVLIAVMPQRVGASRLYSLAGGVTVGWIICLGSSFAPEIEIDRDVINRSLVTLTLLTPAVVVWLIYRRRDVLAVIFVLAAMLAALLLKNYIVLSALMLSFGLFLTSLWRPDQTRYYLGMSVGLITLFAPLIPIILTFPLSAILGDDHSIAQIFQDWFRIIADDPFRLLTGHGFDTIGRAAAAGLIPPNAPHGLLIDTWFELGIIGAMALAATLTSLVMLSSTMTRPSAAAVQAVIASIMIIGTFGGNAPQLSWLFSLALAGVALQALQRGQYKTARPGSRDLAALNQKTSGFTIFPDRYRF